MADGMVKGYFVMGENPAVGSMNNALQRKGLRQLEWLVVRDFAPNETAEFWRDGAGDRPGRGAPEDIGTEVFFFPCAAHTEKDGAFTNTQRLLQWHHKAVEPPGRLPQRSALHLSPGKAAEGAVRRAPTDPKDRPDPGPDMGLPDARVRIEEPDAEAVLAEINGYTASRPEAAFAIHGAEGRRHHRLRLLDLQRLPEGRGQPDCPAQAGGASRTGWRWNGAGPGRQTGGCSTTARPPILTGSRGRSGKNTSGGTRRRRSGPASTPPISSSTVLPTIARAKDAKGIDTLSGIDPFIMQAEGKAWLYDPSGLLDGPLPTHYEPQESVLKNPLYGQQCNPARMEWMRRDNPYHKAWGDPRYPVHRHHLPPDRAPHGGRHEPMAAMAE